MMCDTTIEYRSYSVKKCMKIETLLLLLGVINICALIALALVVRKMTKHYRELTKGVGISDLQTVLEKQLSLSKEQQTQIEKLFQKFQVAEKDMLSHVQKVGFKRYNPYEETGGDQSFILVFLDKKDDGVVISSLHGRTGTRVYAKPLRGGEGKGYELSKEESLVVSQTQKKANN